MNDNEDFESVLGTALRDRTDAIHPDLDGLAAASLRAGVGIRRHRRIGVSVGSAAAVAGVLGAVTLTGHLGQGGAVHDTNGFASQGPSAKAALHEGERIDLGHGITATIHACKRAAAQPGVCTLPGVHQPTMSPAKGGSGSGFGVVLSGHPTTVADLEAVTRLAHRYPGITIPLPSSGWPSSSTKSGPYDVIMANAHTALTPQWSCGTIADDKFACNGDGDFSVVARPKADLAGWKIKGSVEAKQVAWVGEDCFLTVQGPTDHRLDILKAKVAAAEK